MVPRPPREEEELWPSLARPGALNAGQAQQSLLVSPPQRQDFQRDHCMKGGGGNRSKQGFAEVGFGGNSSAATERLWGRLWKRFGGRSLAVGNAVGAGVGVWEWDPRRVRAGVLGARGIAPAPLRRSPGFNIPRDTRAPPRASAWLPLLDQHGFVSPPASTALFWDSIAVWGPPRSGVDQQLIDPPCFLRVCVGEVP